MSSNLSLPQVSSIRVERVETRTHMMTRPEIESVFVEWAIQQAPSGYDTRVDFIEGGGVIIKYIETEIIE